MVPRDTTPPKVSTDSVLVMVTIDAHEGCYVVICNILGGFISADRDKDVKVALHGRLVKIIVKIVPQL